MTFDFGLARQAPFKVESSVTLEVMINKIQFEKNEQNGVGSLSIPMCG